MVKERQAFLLIRRAEQEKKQQWIQRERTLEKHRKELDLAEKVRIRED